MTEKIDESEQKYVHILIEKNDRPYRFIIPVGAPLGEAFDVSVEISRQLVAMAQKMVEEKQETKE